jgi:hypothetical protein
MIVWTVAVRSWDEAIQYRKGMGTETTHWRVGTQGMTCSTRCAAVCAMRPPRTRRAKPPPLAAESEQQLVVAGVTAQSHKAVREDAALQVVVQFAFHISGQASGVGIGVERGEKGLQMIGNDVIEHSGARIAWHIRG